MYNQNKTYKMKKQIPPEIINGFQEVATKYSRSPATTNAGRVLRFISRITPIRVVYKILATKIG